MEIISITKEINKKTFQPIQLVTFSITTEQLMDLKAFHGDSVFDEIGRLLAQELKDYSSKTI
jgi:hypothetical protein